MGSKSSTAKVISEDPNWWRQATVYQIYPRSFADDNGDGIGDLKGITSRVPYLKALGVDAVWLSPFYPSALKDGGYDVADYKNVDPNIGTLDDFDEMIASFKKVGIKVIVDIVPNHSSDEHVWFKEALKSSPGSAARARYHFLDGKGPDKSQPPNDWEGAFSGSMWEPVGDGQFYMHMFDISQPDLNWDNKEVQDEFLDILKFWGDRGVSGFRVDVASAMSKDLSEPFVSWDEYQRLHRELMKNGKTTLDTHPCFDREANFPIYKEWRKVFNQYNPPLTAVGEIAVSPDRVHLYASPETLGQAFAFECTKQSYHATSLRQTIDELYHVAREAGSTTTWVLSSHDIIRHATRYGIPAVTKPVKDLLSDTDKYCNEFLLSKGKGLDAEQGLRRARAATALMLSLPGCMYFYQGEELGMPEVIDIPKDRRQDPQYTRSNGAVVGRDGCRVPLPWKKNGPTLGFSPDNAKKEPWLPIPQYLSEHSVQAEEGDPESTLSLYRKAISLRHKFRHSEEMEWVGNKEGVLHVKRPGGWEILMNVSRDEGVEIPKGEVVLCSGKLDGSVLPVDTTVWVKVV